MQVSFQWSIFSLHCYYLMDARLLTRFQGTSLWAFEQFLLGISGDSYTDDGHASPGRMFGLFLTAFPAPELLAFHPC